MGIPPQWFRFDRRRYNLGSPFTRYMRQFRTYSIYANVPVGSSSSHRPSAVTQTDATKDRFSASVPFDRTSLRPAMNWLPAIQS